MSEVTGGKRSKAWRAATDPQRIGALYVLILLVIVFTVWLGTKFFSTATLQFVLNNNALLAILALAVIVPLCANEFDLSIGYAVGATAIIFGWLLGHPGLPIGLAVVITIASGVVIGVFNAVVVVKFGINSFIATLATGSLLQAVIQLVSGGIDLTNGISRSADIALKSVRGITLPVVYALVLAIAVWLLLDYTPVGRKLYAVGLGREAARLAGVRSDRLRMAALVVSAAGASIAGIVAVSQIGSATTDTGPGYLIPAYAAAFLGSTQFKPGKFNAWGTVLAVLLLGVLNAGLALAGVPLWVPYVSTGVVLILALALGQIRQHSELRTRRRRWRRDAARAASAADGDLAVASERALAGESGTDSE